MRQATTRQGDSLDLIALSAYGTSVGTTEALLDANPHLAGEGPVYRAGLTVMLPDLAVAPAVVAPAAVRLWD